MRTSRLFCFIPSNRANEELDAVLCFIRTGVFELELEGVFAVTISSYCTIRYARATSKGSLGTGGSEMSK